MWHRTGGEHCLTSILGPLAGTLTVPFAGQGAKGEKECAMLARGHAKRLLSYILGRLGVVLAPLDLPHKQAVKECILGFQERFRVAG